ncbi:MAG: DUF3501 family protein [Myxococcota bacterium]|nr:DUF3501 family protein [Myxococcota bacterium]
MKVIEASEVLGLADYEAVREHFRARVVAEKKLRRVQIGPHVTVMFENRDTALLQIQEMLRTERISRAAAVQHEIDTYNELVPAEGELSCTLMIEIADKIERDAFLNAAVGLEKHVWLVAGDERSGARSSERGGATDRTTAVHYLKFPVMDPLAKALRAFAKGDGPAPRIAIEIDHPKYSAQAGLGLQTLLELGRDLAA